MQPYRDIAALAGAQVLCFLVLAEREPSLFSTPRSSTRNARFAATSCEDRDWAREGCLTKGDCLRPRRRTGTA